VTLLPAEPGLPGAARLLRCLVVGAVVCLVLRLLLVFPADLYARLLGSAVRDPAPGTLAAWLRVPGPDEGFLRLFVLAVWWVGPLVGMALVWRGGGRWTDLVCGGVAGAFAGLGGAATLGAVLVAGDALPRALLAPLSGSANPTGVATPLWIVTAVLCWGALGAGAGLLLALFGRMGAVVVEVAARPLAWVLRAGGMGKAASFFALRG
jgi:hypothetical protein